MHRTALFLIFLTTGLLLPAPEHVQAAELRLFCTQALRTSLLELGPRFEKASGHALKIEVAPSGQLVKRVQDGERADLLIANAENIDALIKDGKIAGARMDIARAQVGLSIRAGAPKPDISTPEAVKQTLLNARAVAYSAGGLSGNAFESVLRKLGIEEQVKARAKHGSPAGAVVARGEADIAVQQISELIAVSGTELVGPLPDGLDQVTQFSMGIPAGAKEPSLAKALIEFLRTPEAQAIIKSKGLTPAI